MSILERLPEHDIISAVLEAGKLLDGAGAVHEVHAKNRTDFVTDVDLRVQETLKARLAELLPEVQFMGEEQDNSAIDWTRPLWILDPVDGTTNLIRALRHSAISLALAEAGRVVFGYQAESSGIQIFQDSDLSAKSDYGLCFRHAVLHSVFRRGPNQLAAHADRLYRHAL